LPAVEGTTKILFTALVLACRNIRVPSLGVGPFYVLYGRISACIMQGTLYHRETFIDSRSYVADGSERSDLSQDDVNRDRLKKKTICKEWGGGGL